MINIRGHIIVDEGKPILITFSPTEAGAIDAIWKQTGPEGSPFTWWAEQQRLPKGYRVTRICLKEEELIEAAPSKRGRVMVDED